MIDLPRTDPQGAENFIAGKDRKDPAVTASHESPKDSVWQQMLDQRLETSDYSKFRYGPLTSEKSAESTQVVIDYLKAMSAEVIEEFVNKLNPDVRARLTGALTSNRLKDTFLGEGQFLPYPLERTDAEYSQDTEQKPEKHLITEEGEKPFLNPPPPGSDQSAGEVASQTPWNKSNSEV